jgi:glycosyltransferase involved in cell wall biosynthesis
MNIAYIINGRIPTEKANGYQISQMCDAFLGLGHEVRIISPQKYIDPEFIAYQCDLKNFYSLNHNVQVQRLYVPDIQSTIHRWIPFLDRFQFFYNIFQTLYYALSLANYFNKNSFYDVIYLRDVNIYSWIKIFLNQEIQKKIYLELHYLPKNILKLKRQVKILNTCSKIITITQRMKEDLLKAGYKGQVLVEHDAVNIEKYDLLISKEEARKKIGIGLDKIIIGYTGKFFTNGVEKGIFDVIQSAVIILKTHNVEFIFVGGPMEIVSDYKKLIDKLGLPMGNFHFIDKQPVGLIPFFNKSFDILLIPLPNNPHFAFYMSPMKLFEYAVSGNPIVATNLPGITEILKDNVNSLIAFPEDPASLADKIKTILNDPKQGLRLAEEAKKICLIHSWDKRAKRILDFIT